MDHLKIIYERLLLETFPTQGGKEVNGIDLVLVDSDTMGIATKFFSSKGCLKSEDIAILGKCYKELKQIVTGLEKSERQYFASMKQLAYEMLEITSRSKLSESEVVLRYKWKDAYDQIKVILNKLDPLGVTDIVLEEYDDLNFRIYSQLLQSKDETKLLQVIKSFVKEDYSTDLTDEEVAKAVKQLMKIQI
jgi:hypothetical protein